MVAPRMYLLQKILEKFQMIYMQVVDMRASSEGHWDMDTNHTDPQLCMYFQSLQSGEDQTTTGKTRGLLLQDCLPFKWKF